jgi:F-type H+-transporting ATPase subunit b
MSIVTPEIGTIFWTTLIFLILLVVLRKYAWVPVLKAVRSREERIKSALDSAEEAREEMARLKADNELIIKEARAERNQLLQEAREMKEKIIGDAREQASSEGKKIVESARAKIRSEKEAALSDIRNQVAELSVEIAGRIIKQKLSETGEQKKLIERYLDDIKLN